MQQQLGKFFPSYQIYVGEIAMIPKQNAKSAFWASLIQSTKKNVWAKYINMGNFVAGKII